MTRFDYDDSFKFFDWFGISEGQNPLLVGSGDEAPTMRVCAGSYFSSQAVGFRTTTTYDYQQIKLAINKFLETSIDEIFAIVDTAFEEVQQYFSNKDIAKWYQVYKFDCQEYTFFYTTPDSLLKTKPDLLNHCHFKESDSNLDKLKSSIKYFLSRRYEEVKEMDRCLKVEAALHFNDVKEINQLISKGIGASEILCLDSFFHPFVSAVGYVSNKQYKAQTPEFWENYSVLSDAKIMDIETAHLKNIPFNEDHNEAYNLLKAYFDEYHAQPHDEL